MGKARGKALGKQSGKVAWADEFTLLCERCGYVIEGLPTEGACPECGKAIVESLPERRVGTPWQQEPSVRSLLSTWSMTIRRPRQTLDRARADREWSLWLGLCGSGTGASLLALGLWFPHALAGMDEDGLAAGAGQTLVWFMLLIVTAAAAWMLLIALIKVETVGLGVIARSRGFRVGPDVRRAITSHGSVGWVIAGSGFFLFAVLARVTVALLTPPDVIENFENGSQIIRTSGPSAPDWLIMAIWVFTWTPVLAGFLFFETFAYLGLRRLKYANRQRPLEQSGTQAIGDSQR